MKETWNVKQQQILEHYEMLNKLKQDWDSLSTQHYNLSQRYIPNNIEVKFVSLYIACNILKILFHIPLGKPKASCIPGR